MQVPKLQLKLMSFVWILLIAALTLAVFSQLKRIHILEARLHDVRANSANSLTQSVSYLEEVELKGKKSRYLNKVFIASDGRKRVESLTSERGLVSIFDDSGIQRLHLIPSTQSASVFEELEPLGSGTDLQMWRNQLLALIDDPKTYLGLRQINGKLARGFQAMRNGNSNTIWLDDVTGEPLQVEIVDQQSIRRFYDVEFQKEMDVAMFSFEVPPGYSVVERVPR